MSVLFSWLLACSFPLPDCAGGYIRNEADVCVELNSEITDTGGTALTGAYQGQISITIDADADALQIQDVCEGSVAFDRVDSELTGEVQCGFTGTVASLIGEDPFDGTMDGSVAADGATAGQILLNLGTFGLLDEAWTGTTTSEQIDGSFVGEMSFTVGALEVPVWFEGSFSAAP